MTDPRADDALVLAETALTAAHVALEQSQVAEAAAVRSVELARHALSAAQAAHDQAQLPVSTS